MSDYTEDTLAQKTTADYLANALAWDESVYALHESFGANGLLGRTSESDVILDRDLLAALAKFNPGFAAAVYASAVKILKDVVVGRSLESVNRDKHELLKDGVPVSYKAADGTLKKTKLRVFDFAHPEANRFLCVREFWVAGSLGRRRRADVVGFVNGVPLVFMELKNVHKDIRLAYENNFRDYLKVIPQLFHFNAFVILGNGIEAKVGTITAKYKFFHAWKRLAEDDPGVVDMETLLKGACCKHNLLDLFENFILFDESTGKVAKILARNHQFLGVNRAVDAVARRESLQGKLGVFWHTQGSGKSYSMVYFARKVRRTLGGNFTFVILTDREELDTQIYKTFAGCGLADNDKDPCRAASGAHLKTLLKDRRAYVFSLIQKFNEELSPGESYTDRDDVIVISDEAHRTQYGRLALNLRTALPKAGYIGFTGTPLFRGDELTRQVFGDYVSKYDFQRAVDDGATVPLFYDARGEKLQIATEDINDRVLAALDSHKEELAQDVDLYERLESELKRDYHVITAEKRLEQVARDFVQHYSTSWGSGKAMIVCIDKVTCVRVHDLVVRYWKEKIAELEAKVGKAEDEQEELFLGRQIAWMKETVAAVIVSEEQNEDEKFSRWGLDILPHRKVMKEGMSIPAAFRDKLEYAGLDRMSVDEAFKESAHPFRIAIVCAMWLTGFDVPSLATLYLDKPLKAHTLMQAIARANRVNEGKNNGLIVDYCGILKNLRQALATFATSGGAEGDGGENPLRPPAELIAELAEAIRLVEDWLDERRAPLQDVVARTGFARNAAIQAALEAANENDEIRKRFEIMCRTVFAKFKACITFPEVNQYRKKADAIDCIYKMLQKGRDEADISGIMRELHRIVDEAVRPRNPADAPAANNPYDISKIDFAQLKAEFAGSKTKNTKVQALKGSIEARLQRMLAQNPMRTDFQQHYENLVSAYNHEKDRQTIEQTFEALLRFVAELDVEEARAAREGLSEENLALLDLLMKPNLKPAEIERVKKVAENLLSELKHNKLQVHHWREKEMARDAVHAAIYNFLYDDARGLPASYQENEIREKSDLVYSHIFDCYPYLPSPYYGAVSAGEDIVPVA